jgi:hypothetical protein
MPTFAIVENGVVINTLMADSKAIAEEVTSKTCIEYTASNPACIGLGYDGTTFEQQPPAEAPTE